MSAAHLSVSLTPLVWVPQGLGERGSCWLGSDGGSVSPLLQRDQAELGEHMAPSRNAMPFSFPLFAWCLGDNLPDALWCGICSPQIDA